jgi:hypothetical protein
MAFLSLLPERQEPDMSYANQKAAEAGGWTWYLVGDTVGELRVERPAAWKLFDGNNRKEVVGDSEAAVLRAINDTEIVHFQHLANVAHQKKQEADAKKAEGK